MNVHILLAGLGHSLERVEKIKMTVRLIERKESLSDGHHAAPSPNPALDDVPFNATANDVLHRLDQCVDSLGRCHRVWPNGFDNSSCVWLDVQPRSQTVS